MHISKSFIPILKNNPSEAKIKSHQLMLRVGMIKQSSAGIYSWLPLGFKVMKKIERIVREEQNKIGAQEILMPTIQSSEIWKESGRYEDYGEEMLRIKDRQDREMLYGPTNEELVTDIFRSSLKSYKSLPQLLYHIQWKFRDEIRPRFGIMRCREFYMKDAYSFDVTDEDALFSYNKFFLSYLKTFKRLDLTAIPMAADTGPIGGNLSHEFIILAETGESKIYADKRIFDLNFEGTKLDVKSLLELRNQYEKFYSVTDDKFKEDEFNEKVSEKNRLKTKGIEVGHIFYFGDKYSKPMEAAVDLPGGKKDYVKMGSYGIGVSRLVGAIIEAKYDEKNEIMKWPISVAPYDIAIIPMINKNDTSALDKANKISLELNQNNIDAIIDDTDENLSSKIKKMNLIGAPYQIIIGKKSDGDLLELKEIGKEGVLKELRSNDFNENTMDTLGELLELKGNAFDQFHILEKLLVDQDEGLEGINELKFIFSKLQASALKTVILNFDLTLARGLNYYTGMIVEADSPKNINIGSIGGELFLSNVKDFSRGGTILGLRAQYKVSESLPLRIGLNYISDANMFSSMKDKDGDSFPDVFDDFPSDSSLWNDTDGDGWPDPGHASSVPCLLYTSPSPRDS